jgi:hypothetical protein
MTIASQVAAAQVRPADPSRNESLAKTAQLRGDLQQQLIIPYSPDVKISPGQVLNVEVRFVVDTTTGKVIDSSIPVNTTPVSDAAIDRLIDRIFEQLVFDVNFETAAVNKAQFTEWLVPVQIQVLN